MRRDGICVKLISSRVTFECVRERERKKRERERPNSCAGSNCKGQKIIDSQLHGYFFQDERNFTVVFLVYERSPRLKSVGAGDFFSFLFLCNFSVLRVRSGDGKGYFHSS